MSGCCEVVRQFASDISVTITDMISKLNVKLFAKNLINNNTWEFLGLDTFFTNFHQSSIYSSKLKAV
jgi:hypothetical protein